MYVGAIGSIDVPAFRAFDFVGILPMVGAEHATMATTALPVWINVADLNGRASSARPIPILSFLTHCADQSGVFLDRVLDGAAGLG
jgi:hypothetical protein